MDGFVRQIHAPFALVAETLAVREALSWLKQKQGARTEPKMGTDLHVEISSDNASVVECVSGRIESPWAAWSIINDCKSLLAQLRGVKIRYEHRDTNQAVDWIAKAHGTDSLPPNWLSKPPILYG
ncbi:hypothetical protein NL676_039782 [Syzygium grande]|nr:hypothetical protein NL676_039782 [Syzygium grande]